MFSENNLVFASGSGGCARSPQLFKNEQATQISNNASHVCLVRPTLGSLHDSSSLITDAQVVVASCPEVFFGFS